jgi:hypothetical protein
MNSAMRSLVLPALVLALAACDVQRVDPPPPASSSTAAPTSANKPASTGATAAKADPIEDEVATLTKAWNDALAKRDAKALEALYAKNVRLYTVDMTREKAVKAKAEAFANDKEYTQSIAAVEFDTRKKTEPRALFNKTWKAKGAEQQVRASLVFAKEDGKWVIKEESDVPSDQRRMRAAQNADGCESLVQKLASSTPEAMAVLNTPTNPAKGHLSNGTRIGGGPPEQQTYSIGIHENHSDRIVTMMWIDVDPKTGAMTSVMDPDKPLKGAPDLVEQVKKACAK